MSMQQVDDTITGTSRAFYLRTGATLQKVRVRVSSFSAMAASIGSRDFPVDPPFTVARNGWHIVTVNRDAECVSVRLCSDDEVSRAVDSIKPDSADIARALERFA